jgi:PPOX class probable F420-dependent enzyme
VSGVFDKGEQFMAKQTIPQGYMDLFEKRAFANLATLMPDGSPQVTPVWVEFDGTYVVINSARGRVKDRNMERDGRVAVSIQDPDNPYRFIQIRGRVAKTVEEGADAGIDRLAKKYMGVDIYPNHRADETRVMYMIEPLAVTAWG